MKVVAFGTSYTAGRFVPNDQIFSARLGELLRAQGENVDVRNQGVNGNTSRNLVARMNTAVPEGTHVVILEISLGNDAEFGVSHKETIGNAEQIVSRLRARRIEVLQLLTGQTPAHLQSRLDWYGESHAEFLRKNQAQYVLVEVTSSMLADGQHMNAVGHSKVAASLVGPVMEALARARARARAGGG
jgi:lysophospholipase L1-like esterase